MLPLSHQLRGTQHSSGGGLCHPGESGGRFSRRKAGSKLCQLGFLVLLPGCASDLLVAIRLWPLEMICCQRGSFRIMCMQFASHFSVPEDFSPSPFPQALLAGQLPAPPNPTPSLPPSMIRQFLSWPLGPGLLSADTETVPRFKGQDRKEVPSPLDACSSGLGLVAPA